MKSFLSYILLGLSSIAYSMHPNMIIIFTDDQGYADVGFHGSTEIPTPNIDRIADNGVVFTNGYVTFPTCGPSRAGLLTGRYQGRFGFNFNPTTNPAMPHAGISHNEETIAEILAKADYHSMIIGKWHMGSHPSQHPLNRGFNEFFGFLAGGLRYFPEELILNDLSEVERMWQWYQVKLMRDFEQVESRGYLTDVLSNEAVKFLERQSRQQKPFFLYLAYNAPHGPLQATEKYLKRFSHIEDEDRRTYAAMVSALDDGVGRLLDTLNAMKLHEGTIVVFLSDNGGARTNASDNTPLRDYKGTLFEGGIRVPFAMQWPGVIEAGSVFEEPVISMDILATMVGLTEVDIADKRPLDGVNLLPYLSGKNKGSPHETLFWKDIRNSAWAVRKGNFKVVFEPEDAPEPLLFDLSVDFSENNDLASKYPEIVKSFAEAFEQWNQTQAPNAFPGTRQDRWWER